MGEAGLRTEGPAQPQQHPVRFLRSRQRERPGINDPEPLRAGGAAGGDHVQRHGDREPDEHPACRSPGRHDDLRHDRYAQRKNGGCGDHRRRTSRAFGGGLRGFGRLPDGGVGTRSDGRAIGDERPDPQLPGLPDRDPRRRAFIPSIPAGVAVWQRVHLHARSNPPWSSAGTSG